ncbi:hypothetical protein ANO11243_019400 [Dothideomycetidae sp. 11243]|nr:hypothetical protein ANO11243_019400 [fungal sp. No.11243]
MERRTSMHGVARCKRGPADRDPLRCDVLIRCTSGERHSATPSSACGLTNAAFVTVIVASLAGPIPDLQALSSQCRTVASVRWDRLLAK